MNPEKMPLLLTCEELDKFIVDYVDGKLTIWERMKFRLHLTGCAECRAYLEGYQKSIAIEKKVFEDPDRSATSEAPEELIQAIIKARPK